MWWGGVWSDDLVFLRVYIPISFIALVVLRQRDFCGRVRRSTMLLNKVFLWNILVPQCDVQRVLLFQRYRTRLLKYWWCARIPPSLWSCDGCLVDLWWWWSPPFMLRLSQVPAVLFDLSLRYCRCTVTSCYLALSLVVIICRLDCPSEFVMLSYDAVILFNSVFKLF